MSGLRRPDSHNSLSDSPGTIHRQKDIYDRLEAEWHQWNATMLAEIDDSSTGGISGDEWADHIGARKASGKADNPDLPSTPTKSR